MSPYNLLHNRTAPSVIPNATIQKNGGEMEECVDNVLYISFTWLPHGFSDTTPSKRTLLSRPEISWKHYGTYRCYRTTKLHYFYLDHFKKESHILQILYWYSSILALGNCQYGRSLHQKSKVGNSAVGGGNHRNRLEVSSFYEQQQRR